MDYQKLIEEKKLFDMRTGAKVDKILHLEPDMVTSIYAIPYKRKRKRGDALLIRPIWLFDNNEVWEVQMLDTGRISYEWISVVANAPDLPPEPKTKKKKK